ncbi:MAG TPA: Ig-like domain-containing protein [Gemmatimonadales bacterium]
MKRFGLSLLIALALIDCGGGDGGGPTMITAVLISGDSTVALAGTRQLTATARSGSSPVSAGVSFDWVSSDTTLAKVSPAGLVSGRARGTVTITAFAVLNATPTGVSGTHAVRVRIGSVVLTAPAGLQFASLGDTLAVSAEARDAANAPVPAITFGFQSRNAGAVQASPANATTALLVAISNGTSRIVVTGDGVSDSVTATVQQVAVSLSITPDTATFDRLGAAVTPVVTGADARGNPVSPAALNWTSQLPAVATVSTTGAITSTGGGTTRVIATSGTQADTVHVVVQQVGARVKLHPLTLDTSRIVVTVGSMRMIDSVFDGNDSLIRSPTPSVTWSSTAAAATVDGGGVVTASGSTGITFIKAVSGTGRDSALIQVVSSPTTLNGAVQPIFTVSCAGCHFAGGQANMNLTSGAAFSNIVNTPAGESALDRAEPFVPDSSYLVHKIQGTHLQPPANGSGARMPFECTGASCLTKGQINIIRNWILQGAQNN